MNLEKQIINLETTVTYQEELISQLNEVVYKQGKELALLQKQIESIIKQLSDSNQPMGKEPPPPHY